MGVIFMVKNRLLSCKIANDPFHMANIVDWRTSVRVKHETDDYIHLGCPLRSDGQSPEATLQGIVARLSGVCHTWDLSEKSLLIKVQIMNSFILSKIRHATQLCP